MADGHAMKPIEEVYPEQAKEEAEDGCFCRPGDYNPMLESFGYETLLQVDDRGYQGDSRLLYRDGERIGYLNFGWGSCSGCDSLQACDSMADIEKLRNSLHDSIRWFDSPGEALRWFTEHDWEGDYGWREEEQKQFIEKAKTLLTEMVEAADA
jgi:hypothetical protein